MNLFDGLQLLEQIKDGEIKTYLAADPPRGRNLLVHWIPVTAGAEIRGLLELLDSLPQAGRSLILEGGIREGQVYLVTESPAHFPGLREWLGGADQGTVTAEAPISYAAPPPVSAPAEQADPGEFTKLFMVPTVPASQARPAAQAPAAAKAPLPQPSAAPVTNAPAAQQQEGEFTRLFSKPAAPVAPQPPPQVQSPGPGEFTRVFLAGSLPGAATSAPSIPSAPSVPSTSSVPSAPTKKEPGEFTQIFQSASLPQSANLPKQPPQPVRNEKADNDEFNRLLQSPLATPTAPTPSDDYFSKPAPKAPTQQDAGEFTRIFGRPGASPELPQFKGTTGVFATPGAAQTQSASGQSEFTRILGPQSLPAIPEPAPAAAPAKPAVKPAAAPNKSLLPLILILAVLAVLALVLIFLFVRK